MEMEMENYSPVEPDDSASDDDDDDTPMIFSVTEDEKKSSFTRRHFINVAAKIGVGAAILGGAAASAAQTETPTPTASGTPTLCMVTANTSSVQVHVGVGRNRGVRAYLPENQSFRVLKAEYDINHEIWYQIDIPTPNLSGAETWVYGGDVRVIGDCDEESLEANSFEQCTVITDNENIQVHVGPGRSRAVRAYLPANEEFVVLGVATDIDGGLWYKVDIPIPQLAGQETWVYSRDVESFGGCSQLNAADVPPVRTATSGQQATPTNAAPEISADHPGDVPPGQTGINYTASDGTHYNLPCGSPIPAGAVCTCNCVTVPAATPENPSSGGGGSHYWYPN